MHCIDLQLYLYGYFTILYFASGFWLKTSYINSGWSIKNLPDRTFMLDKMTVSKKLVRKKLDSVVTDSSL